MIMICVIVGILLLLWSTDAIGQSYSSRISCRHASSEERKGKLLVSKKMPHSISCQMVSKKWDGLKSGLASALAAAVIKIILQPFDTVKTLQQMSNQGIGNKRAVEGLIGMWNTGIDLCKSNRGPLALWSGLYITVIGSSPSVATYFGVYSSCKQVFFAMPYFAFDDKNGFYNRRLLAVALSATIGNTMASVLRVPYEVLKQRIQAGQHSSTWEAIKYSLAVEGPLGLFQSGKLSSQIVRDVPYAVITLLSYEMLQRYFKAKSTTSIKDGIENEIQTDKNTKRPPGRSRSQDALCGAIAGGLGSFLTTPMDVIKTRLMTGSVGVGLYSGEATVWKTAVNIYRHEGINTFFSGYDSRLMHKIPANGLFFLLYELFKGILGVSE